MADLISEQQLAQLVKEVKQLPPPRGYSPTFLEMAGFSERETVWSRILQFYFDSTNGHGLGNAVFQAFMSIVGVEVVSGVDVRARREERLEGDKRLDLVLETADMVVGIENKVNHDLNNDLAAYRRHLDSLAYGRDVYAVVLSRDQIRDDKRTAGWRFVTYDVFGPRLHEICERLQIDNKYRVFLKDFVTSITKPDQGSTMDTERLEFFTQHRAEVDTLLKEVAALRLDMRRKVETLRGDIQAAHLPSRVPLYSGLLAPGFEFDEGLKELVWNRIEFAPDFVLIMDIILEPDGWKIAFYNYSGPQDKAKQWIKERGIVNYHSVQNPYRSTKNLWRTIVDEPVPGYKADRDQVREWALKYLVKVLPAA